MSSIFSLQNKPDVDRLFQKLRTQNLMAMIIGYAVFYFVRKNFSIALPALIAETGHSKAQFGLILTLFSVVYGLGRFFNGVLADKTNAAWFMSLGLFGSALINLAFGFVPSLFWMGMIMIANAWFQSMGMPATIRLLTQWFSPLELGTKWSLQSTAHQIGGALIYVLCGVFLIPLFGWRSAFFVPAAIAMITAIYLLKSLCDSPQAVGLPPVEVYRCETIYNEAANQQSTVRQRLKTVFRNRLVWVVALTNVFVYAVRVGILDWAPTFLSEQRGTSLGAAGVKTAAFEMAGIAGCLLCGWVSDKIFKGRRGPVGAVSLGLLTIVLLAFVIIPPGHPWLDTVLLMAAGVLVYGPQFLLPLAATDFVGKEAAATASGLVGWSGYVGAALTGVGTGFLADHWGWNAGLLFFVVNAFLGTTCFCLFWKKRAAVFDQIEFQKTSSLAESGLCEKAA